MTILRDIQMGKLPKKERFSKAFVAKAMGRKAGYLMFARGFTDETGWVQVENKGEAVNRDYGEYIAMVNLAGILDLSQEFWTEVHATKTELEERQKNRLTK